MSADCLPCTILVVDDDPGVARLMERELRREGYLTSTAGSGREATNWLDQHQADLLLLDLKLPDMEGPELVRIMTEKKRSVPFVIITGQGDERVAVDMMKRGALDYLVKDVKFIEFVPTVVQRALAQVAQQKQLAAAGAELRATNEGLREEIAKRRLLEKEILNVSEREQQRIGQDLHDDLGQHLAGTWLLSDTLKKKLVEKGLAEAADAAEISVLLKDALALTRTLARGLHPVAIADGGLFAALSELSARTRQMFRVRCDCQSPPNLELDIATATHLYRIAQEAVTNAVKHGGAKKISIEISTNPHSCVLSVKNDGEPLPASPSGEGMGLRIMRYRADLIGAALELQNNPDNLGTVVVCTLPAAKPIKPTSEPSHGQESNPRVGKPAAKKSVHR